MAVKKYDSIFTKEYLENEYVVKNRTATDIGSEWDCSRKTVTNYLYEHDIVPKNGRPSIDRSGQKYGLLTVIRSTGQDSRNNTLWECRCDGCGKIHVVSNVHIKKVKSCGCARRPKGHKKFPGYFYTRIKDKARCRNLVLNVSVEYLGDLFESQDYKCALTGWSIYLGKMYNKASTASLDRIDSSKGYIPGNVQWLHKDVNRMKWCLPQDRFLEICHVVSEKWK